MTKSTTIRNLFDPSKDIYRTIERVITFAASQESRLKAEISEYVVTESIEEQLQKLLDKMQLAMEAGAENEVGVWVSGFYGSGKSSFTKYLGLSLGDNVIVDGVPFLKHLQDRLHTPQVKAQLAAVAGRFPAAVVLLDLASEMLAGATMEEVSTVLYYKVLQWAGYSRNLKVAALERRIEKDDRFAEFEDKIEAKLAGLTWKDIQNDPLAVDALIPEIAHEMYPVLFPTPNAFTSSTEGFFKFEDERVKEMIDIVRKKSGREYIVFIVDEVGQYIAARDNLILNLDGLAKNLKNIGEGKVWIVTTAQQTLTEDDPRATLNSDKLYKLKDRFPIQVDLESRDIKEICYRRLLGKSSAGETELGKVFDAYGQQLRHNTRLQDAKFYDSDFSRQSFTNLYPFLPAHFDILLHLLGALAKSTGGFGLRSAIKVIQDVLIEGEGTRAPAANQPVGWLASTVTIYDSLEKDIRRANSSIHHAVNTTCIRFHESTIHQDVAKSVAVLQILGNLPVTSHNVASLIHPTVDHTSRLDEVRKAVAEMLNDPQTPLIEKDGNLSFLSEKLSDIEKERGEIPIRTVELRRIFNDALRGSFDPLPRTSLHGTHTVTSGLKVRSGSSLAGLAGEQNTIQTVIEFVSATDYANATTRLMNESRERSSQNTIYLVSQSNAEAEDLNAEIYRCQRIAEIHRTDPDGEVRDYCASQIDRSTFLSTQLQQKIKEALSHGSFIFRGQPTAVKALDHDLVEASKKLLSSVAEQVFERYAEAAERVDTATAEKLLRIGNPAAITTAIDPLGLWQLSGGRPSLNSSHKAMVSIRDYVENNGTVDGKRLLNHFSEAPFGWSADTTRYILAAMLMGGEIKLKVSGREVTAVGQQAVDALKTNRSFGSIGVALRDERPSLETVARAAERLTDLIGEKVIPLEQEISKAAVKNFSRFQFEYAPLSEKLASLSLSGAERLRTLNRDIADVLFTDASDATQRLGGEESNLHENLKWASEVKRALDSGLETTIRELQSHRRAIESLPDTGVPGELRRELAEDLQTVAERLQKDDFYKHTADLNSQLTDVQAGVRDAAAKLQEQLKTRLKEGTEDLQRLPEWWDLTQEEQSNVAATLDNLSIAANDDLAGLRRLLARDYDINTTLSDLKESVRRQSQNLRRQRLEEERAKFGTKEPLKLRKAIAVSPSMSTAEQIDDLIRQLQEVRSMLALYEEVEITFNIQE